MHQTAYRPLSPAQAVCAAAGAAVSEGRSAAQVDIDRLDFDSWLLAPSAPGTGERLVQLASRAAGPSVLIATVAAGLAALF